MPKKETLQQFVKNLHKMSPAIQKMALTEWNQNTFIAANNARELAPFALGNLFDSINSIKARITPKGIVSYIVAKVPYAKMLETGFDRNGNPIQLKSPGEISYYANGTKILKRRKGVIGFMGKGIDKAEHLFIEGLKTVISKAWRIV